MFQSMFHPLRCICCNVQECNPNITRRLTVNGDFSLFVNIRCCFTPSTADGLSKQWSILVTIKWLGLSQDVTYVSITTKNLSRVQHSAICGLFAASAANRFWSVCRKSWFSYLPGSGGLGGGLVSFSMDSELCECDSDLTPCLSNTDEDVCSKICRSRGVRGMSGRELRWGRSAP